MILVTVGTQLAFDRLTGVVDKLAETIDEEVIAQVGPSNISYKNISAVPFMGPAELEVLVARARLIIAHAGMGSIISALQYRKPIIIVPRKATLGEHRNEHQMATAKRMVGRKGVFVVFDEEQLAEMISEVKLDDQFDELPEFADSVFISRLRSEVLR